MDTSSLQSMLAAPIVAFSFYYAVWSLLNPRRVSILGLSCAIYGIQFCLGPILGLIGISPVMFASSQAVLIGFTGIYAFWLTVLFVTYVIRSPLEQVMVVEKSGIQRSRGLFTNMAKVSSTIKLTPFLMAYLLIVFIRLWLHFTYGTVLSGTVTLEAGMALPYYARVIYQIASPLGYSLTFAIMVMAITGKNKTVVPILMGIMALEFLFGFTQGRRWLIMMVIFAFFGAITIRGGLKIKHAIALVVVMLVMSKFVSPLFHFTRNEWEEHPDRSVMEWLSAGFKKMSETDPSEYEKTISSRLNAISFSYEIADKLANGDSPMNGAILENTFLMTVPRIFVPDKLNLVTEPDTLVNQFFGLGNVDQTSNLPSFGLADFGILGDALYGLLFALSIRAIELMLRWLFRNTRLLAIGAVGTIALDCMFSMEATTTSFANDVRGVLLILLLGWVLKYVVRGGRALYKGPAYWTLVKGIPQTGPVRLSAPGHSPLQQRQLRPAQMVSSRPFRKVGLDSIRPPSKS